MPTTVLMKMLMMLLLVRFTTGRKRRIPPHLPRAEHRDGGDVADLVGDRDERRSKVSHRHDPPRPRWA